MRWERQGVLWQGMRKAAVVVGEDEGLEESLVLGLVSRRDSCVWRRYESTSTTPR
jgi:hypothetical protein